MDRKLIDEWKKQNNILIGKTKGGRDGQIITFESSAGKISAKCFGDLSQGSAIALRDESGQWWVYSSAEFPRETSGRNNSSQEISQGSNFRKQIEYRRSGRKKSFIMAQIYIEHINSQDKKGIEISLELNNNQSTQIAATEYTGDESPQQLSELFTESILTYPSSQQFKFNATINITNQDYQKTYLVPSIECLFNFFSNQITFTKVYADNGAMLSLHELILEEYQDNIFCLSRAKPFVLHSFVSRPDEGNTPYETNLSSFFISSHPNLARDEIGRNHNRNFILVWRFRDRSSLIYASGYVSDSGLLKISNQNNNSAADFNANTYIFTTRYPYPATMEIQIGAADIQSRKSFWYNSITNMYSIENGLNDYLPFNNRNE